MKRYIKLSVALDAESVHILDAEAKRTKSNRSQVLRAIITATKCHDKPEAKTRSQDRPHGAEGQPHQRQRVQNARAIRHHRS